MIKVLFVCHGNICRSPMAEFVLKDMVKKAGRENEFFIASAATSTEEIGNPVHRGTKNKLNQYGIDTSGKYAVQISPKDFEEYDYIICMDSYNIRNLGKIDSSHNSKVCKLLDFAGGGDIADPWYTGNFDETYEDVLKGCKGFIDSLK